MSGNALPEAQREVQRLLGRCLLRIQQYERLMKGLLAQHELAGSQEGLQDQRARRSEKFSDKTLGTLVKSLLETCVVPEGFERDLLPQDRVPADRTLMAFSCRVSIEPGQWAQTRTAIEELVKLRNDLVHHLIERFDVWAEEGCIAAARHLQESYERIDRHCLQLQSWAKGMEAARTAAASLIQSEAFHDLWVNGIAPDGSFEWPATGIVGALREGIQVLAGTGWARLDELRAWLAQHHPGQVPEKYACRTWPQVLSESRQFELQYRPGSADRRTAWVRCRH